MYWKEMFKKDCARIRRKIEKYNKELAAYVEMTGDNDVPDIDCTIIGTSPMNPIEVKQTEKGIAFADDGFWESIEVVCECGEYYFVGEDELDDLLKDNRRRLRKGIRVWKSEKPDLELEKDEEE